MTTGERQAFREYEKIDNIDHERRRAKMQSAYNYGAFGMTSDEVEVFMQHFAEICSSTRFRVGAAAPESFKKLVADTKASEQDMMYLALLLVQNKQVEQDRYWGRRLLDALSAAGFMEATIRIVNNAVVQAKTRPDLLRNAAVAVERGRLQKYVREGTSSRAMVLEGKCAYALGDVDTALNWWWQAVEGAVEKSKEVAARRAAGKEPRPSDFAEADRSDLSSPWIELIEAHFERSLRGKDEWDKCEKAIQIGIGQDDPQAFYYAATYYKQRYDDGSHMPTSDWLYYMTKAAASGVPKAAYELGVFYAESGWKYIEDEPPEHVKPTPFDRYPGKADSQSPWDLIRRIFWPSQEAKISEKDSIFHSAAWPDTPIYRLRLAMRWFDIAAEYMYAPAYLYLAKLLMQDTLWAGAQAPPEALSLSPKRYLYTSKKDEADAHFTGDVKSYELPEDAVDPPNPAQNIELAKKGLLHVFVAREYVMRREEEFKLFAKKDRSIKSEDDLQTVHTSENYWVTRWGENEEVFLQWQKESLAMYQEAAAICDMMGWSIYSTNGHLFYKPGVGGLRNIHAT